MKATIGIGKDVRYRKDFKQWLKSKGYKARLQSVSSYDGVNIRYNPDARDKWKELYWDYEVETDI